ncbi:senescence-associated carboxylesterase 101-like [Abrus precatorius]|uniref:Senescence-associated carboxylesterase 101-like n=1 Tax=Abrus precatorius TaxID=3816 RepID=A0A8B8LV89_ABRPR|nr:senescence-associated carboxylesterase 101-like [Abrus precatorius]
MDTPWSHDIISFHKQLTLYWEKMVEEANIKPQKESDAYRKSWLYAGTSYRRMVEPLTIAEYYRDGGKDYVTKNRPKHFILLEKWFRNETTKDKTTNEEINVEFILTTDSCFWAHVEEALLLCKEFKVVREKQEIVKKLIEFEDYLYGLLQNYEVSPEIFLKQSSCMRWWNKYRAIKGSSYNSALTSFMKDPSKRVRYALGAYDFPYFP